MLSLVFEKKFLDITDISSILRSNIEICMTSVTLRALNYNRSLVVIYNSD